MRATPLLTRREALSAFAAATLATRNALPAEAPFRFGSLDHIALAVDDTEMSVRFYTRLFGNIVMKEKTNPRQYVKLGPNYVAMAPPDPGQPLQMISHFCAGIVNFDLAATRRTLDQLGIHYTEAAGVGIFVPDPDGTQIQLWTEDSWSHLGETAAPVDLPFQGEPLFRPTGIDHLSVNVSNVEKSSAFYEKIFGPVIPGGNPQRPFFSAGGRSRVGIALPGPGRRSGIDHFCLTAPLGRDSLTKAVETAGAKITQANLPAGMDFLDVSGIHVQITRPAV
jgi:catechol 2,3-dioxygenase-like lactoylglutathione lyase family enzyme